MASGESLDVYIYVKPADIQDLTLWNDEGIQRPLDEIGVVGEYRQYNARTSPSSTLKAPGYEDLLIEVGEGVDNYFTMEPVKNYISSITHKGTTYTIKDAKAREDIATKQDALPSQSGNSGKFLTTNGTSVSWGVVDALPDQTSQSGKFLTTDGSSASWATVQAGPKFLTFQNITASTWVSDNTYSEYSYKCVLTCTGVTSSDYAQVIFNPAQSVSGNYANVCLTNTDTVTIYSKVNTAISIPTITVIGSN